MKTKRFLKMALSMLMAVVTLVTVASVSCFSGGAAGNEVTYKITVNTAGSLGISAGEIYFTIHGTDGRSVKIFLPAIGLTQGCTKREVKAADVGQICGITIFNNTVFDDDWYPNSIIIESSSSSPVILYAGRWCDTGIQNISVDDRIAILKVNTGKVKRAGTDCDVFVTLYDRNGVSSGEINLTNISTAVNAFEKGDSDTYFIKLPQEFGTLYKAVFRTSGNSLESRTGDWYLQSVDVCIKRPSAFSYALTVDSWVPSNTSYTCYF